MICEPRPDNSVNCVEITKKYIDGTEYINGNSGFYIIGQWGEETPEGLIQKGVIGDFICQSRTDSTDVWIVARKYSLIHIISLVGEIKEKEIEPLNDK